MRRNKFMAAIQGINLDEDGSGGQDAKSYVDAMKDRIYGQQGEASETDEFADLGFKYETG